MCIRDSSWTISTSWPPWPDECPFSTSRGRRPERRIAAHARASASSSRRDPRVPRVPRPDRRHDVAVGSPHARLLLGRRRSLSRVVDSLVGFSPDVPRSSPPVPREHLLSPEVQPRLQRAQLRHRAAVLPALRARYPPAHRAGARDSPRLRVLRIRSVPARPHAHGLERRGVSDGDRLRVRAVPLRPGVAPSVPLLGLDSPAPRGPRSVSPRAEPKARRVARRLVLHERAFRHPLVRPHVDSPRGDGPHPRLTPWRRARPRRAEARRPRSRNRRNRASALPASLSEGGEAHPDEVTLCLAKTPTKGGLVELPSGTEEHGNYRAVLRAADHGKPLVTAISGFRGPMVRVIERKEREVPIPGDLLDFLEEIPTSYLLVRDSWLFPDSRLVHREWLSRGMAAGRLNFIKRFDGRMRNELSPVVRNEPEAKALEPLPWNPVVGPLPARAPAREDATLTGSIDEPAEGAIVTGPLAMRGWARITGEDLHVTVTIDGEARNFVKGARVPRPDVQAALPSLGDCRTAGYEATYAFEPGDEGVHEIQVLFQASDGRQRHYPPRRFTWKP